MPISPNMGLNIPVVSTTTGPQYAQDVNSSLSKLDAHNHTSGQGVQVPSAGININANLPMNNHGLLNASIINLASQALPPASGTVYRNNDDLYYVDGTGANVRITQGGAVAVSGAVGFSGLPFGTASASYNNLNQSFIFQSATNTPANVDCGSVTLREVVAAANGVTLASPLALAGNYTMRMPPGLPANTQALLLDSTGSITAGGTANSLTATTVNVLTDLSIKNDNGVLQFRDTADAVQFCSIIGTSSGLSANLPDTADSYLFKVNNVTKGAIDNNGVDAQYINFTSHPVAETDTDTLNITWSSSGNYNLTGVFQSIQTVGTFTISKTRTVLFTTNRASWTALIATSAGAITLDLRYRLAGLTNYYPFYGRTSNDEYVRLSVSPGVTGLPFYSDVLVLPPGTYTWYVEARSFPNSTVNFAGIASTNPGLFVTATVLY